MKNKLINPKPLFLFYLLLCFTFLFTLTSHAQVCSADAGTLTADVTPVQRSGGNVTISATQGLAPTGPESYDITYVLTTGPNLRIRQTSASPEFRVTSQGVYTIHTLFAETTDTNSSNYLDLSIIAPGASTGGDVLNFITANGLCAALDVAGAPILVETCSADAGTLMADATPVQLSGADVTISATQGTAPTVPTNYEVAYVLTSGPTLIIEQLGATPEFTVTSGGDYTIHTLVAELDNVADPNFLDVSVIETGLTTGGDVLGIVSANVLCAALDVAGAPIVVETCSADAGTLTADADTVQLVDGTATISATPNGDINIPDGYTSIYVLTQGAGLVIINAGANPSFEVTEGGDYTIHTLVYNEATLDLSGVEIGVTTGVDVLGLLTQGGGDICGNLDVAGAPITVQEDEVCSASAGTLTADAETVCLVAGTATISATPNGDINIPDGYTSIYVLTQGAGLVIVNAGANPSFEVTEGGDYTIHTLVYNEATLDLSGVEIGVTTGVDVLGLLTQGGGDICGNLDVAGAPINVENPSAGTLTADADTVQLVDGTATISATPNGDINIPDGYTSIYVLTQGAGLVIINAGANPSFEVTEGGDYTIHTLVYNEATLDLSGVEIGVTTGVDVLGLLTQGGGDICGNLDVAGAPITVQEDEVCSASAGTLTADAETVCLVAGTATISATPNGDINIPDGYTSIYVLTQGAGLVIVNAGANPSFEVTEGGDYTIHTLVYNEATLDLSGVEIGVTTGVDVLGLLTQGGGDICGNLDVAGAPINVENPSAGTLTADADTVQLVDGTATISATPNGDINIPDGYTSIYVLTQGAGLVIINAGANPSFEVTEGGDYTIHTLVYNEATLDLSGVEIGVTTGVDVLGLLTQGGGHICGNLDVAGAPILVEDEEKCEAYAGTMYSSNPITCLNDGSATIEAVQNEVAIIPEGYQQLFVLTEAFSLTILGVSATPDFEVNSSGFYRIHSLVYNPETLDLSVVEAGVTTGFDVVNIITENNICASLDVHGALNLVIGNRWFCYFFDYYNRDGVTDTKTVDGLVNEYDSFKSWKRDYIDTNSEIKLYPNPVVNDLNIDIVLFDDEIVNYSIFDLSGRQISAGIINASSNGKKAINVNALQSGMYLVNLESDYRKMAKKIQIIK